MQTFTVTGMTCGHCEQAVRKALLALDPQAQVTVDRSQNRVTVESSRDKDTLAHAIEEEGYRVENAQ